LKVLTDAYNSPGYSEWFDEVLSLPALLHLNRDTLKRYLTKEADAEDVEDVSQSILRKWAMIAQ